MSFEAVLLIGTLVLGPSVSDLSPPTEYFRRVNASFQETCLEKDMNKSIMLVASTAFIAATAAMGQDVPDPNPVPNADGTFTYYTGNGMQWTTAQALAACGAGDDVVMMQGSYVQSLSCGTADVTLRPAVVSAGATPSATNCSWESVILWNPTEGPEANNPSAVTVTANNVTVGRPNLMTELANGNITVTTVPASGTGAEYLSDAVLVPICPTNTTPGSLDFGDPNWTGTGTGVKTNLQLGFTSGGSVRALQVQSRSVDKTSIIADNCAANFNCINIIINCSCRNNRWCLCWVRYSGDASG